MDAGDVGRAVLEDGQENDQMCGVAQEDDLEAGDVGGTALEAGDVGGTTLVRS